MTTSGSTGTAKGQGYRPGSLEILAAILVLLVIGQRWLVGLFTQPALQAGATIFVSIIVQALPFLVLGVVLSAAISAFVPTAFWERALPKRPALAVPVAGALMTKGVTPAAALAFLLSSPAINPIVLASTFVAFPNNPMMGWGRLIASLAVSMIMGWLWLRFGKGEWLRIPSRSHLAGATRWQTFRLSATHDFMHAGGFLVIGGLTAAVLNVLVPQGWLQVIASNPVLSILGLALLAVVLCICSEADAFVAASLGEFSLTAKLAFLVVGPMVDLKLVALQTGTFGKSFAARFAPTTFVMAILVSAVVGWWLFR